MKRRRVLVACCWAPGEGQGIGSAAMELASGFGAIGCEVAYLAPEPRDYSWLIDRGIRFFPLGPDTPADRGVRAVLDAVGEFEAEVVVNNDHPYVQAALPSLGCPVIVICHAMRWATASLAVYNHEAATSVVAISYDMWADLLRRGVDIHKVAVLQNGIADRAPSWEPRAGVEQPLRVVFAGNWSRVKGGDRLIEALGAAPSWAASIRLDCFGDGSLMKKAARYESDWCGIHGRVPRESFLSVLSSADMLLLPSRVEGCPMTVIEALCYGVVPIVSDGPGAMRWMVRSGLDGFVVRGSRWARDMWSVIGEVIGNRARLAEMSLLSRRRYEQNYRIEGVAESLLALAQAPSKRTGVVTRAVKWHRPVRGVGGVPGLVARLAYRSGAIRTSVVRK